jgi:hypothetical protein
MATTARRRTPWRRVRHEERLAGRRSIWQSHCNRVRVVRSICIYGDLPEVWRLMQWQPPAGNSPIGCWTIVSRHRTKQAAFTAAEKLLRETQRLLEGRR